MRSRLRLVPASTLICPTIRTCLVYDRWGGDPRSRSAALHADRRGCDERFGARFGSGVARLDGSGCGERFGACNCRRVGDRRSGDGRPVDRDPGNPVARTRAAISRSRPSRASRWGQSPPLPKSRFRRSDAIPPVEAERRILIRRKFRSRAELSLVAGELPLAPTIANLQTCRTAGVSCDRAVTRSLPARTGPRTHRGSEPPRRLGGCGPHARHGWLR